MKIRHVVKVLKLPVEVIDVLQNCHRCRYRRGHAIHGAERDPEKEQIQRADHQRNDNGNQ